MDQQNFKNHSRLVPLFHYVASLLSLATIVGASLNVWYNVKLHTYSSLLILGLSILSLLILYFSRSFALKAQDRAIRAEENFRHFMLAGKPLDSQLRIGQIVALRFAGDDEFVALAQKALTENFSSKEIKQTIKNWKADNYRV